MDKAELEKKIKEIEVKEQTERAKKLGEAAEVYNKRVEKNRIRQEEEIARIRAEKAAKEPNAFQKFFGVTNSGGISEGFAAIVCGIDKLMDKLFSPSTDKKKVQ